MVNRVTLTGHLGANPDVKDLSAGVIANCRLASTDYYKDRASGTMKEATEWHRLVFFGRTAEIARDFLVKGSRIYIDGRLRTRKWSSNGQDRYTTEIVVESLEMIGAPRGQANPEGETTAGAPMPSGEDEWVRAYDEAELSPGIAK
ncbi:single-stranded DNA-binding protein [Caballeronia sp. LjRoot29]|uniref:single-stranded DNA-binding protein n=1 Tax=Caballeronia sp. LjRoot29 TaxID=3342315 RepID=UPI003ECF2BD4